MAESETHSKVTARTPDDNRVASTGNTVTVVALHSVRGPRPRRL
ncbi:MULTISPECIES: hypothetical protein [Streptomyces]|nr:MULTISPECIES: hypothetical protein [Streptomyces]EDX21332.1 hypothetical protein SSAG_01123 [Streptomyces sp. Mg1]WBY18168.1 hypothetical protein PET44_00125 [Streptomyces goshikiensis]WSR96676.1 hypothetical protein OG224_00415 [Streptomyces goshikiensis]WSS02933.1 hypothetical protein OG224_35400 [Streptomyces goshikiensis]